MLTLRQTRINKATKLRNKYNVSLAYYEWLREAQKNKCAVCGDTPKTIDKNLDIDHCHTTKQVRGLLCNPCNTALGDFKDDLIKLEQAIKYLKGEL